MGKIGKGLLGGVSGKVGNIVGGSWKGIDYLRVLPANVANPKSPKQVNQRAKFMMVIRFQQPLTDFVRTGYKAYATKMSAFNAAMSYNFKNAVIGAYPDYSIDYSKVKLSRGNLTGAMDAECSSSASGKLTISWEDNSGNGTARATDKAAVVIYNPVKEDAIFILDAGTREQCTTTIDVPKTYLNVELHCFLSFLVMDTLINTNSKNAISDSAYAGTVTVA